MRNSQRIAKTWGLAPDDPLILEIEENAKYRRHVSRAILAQRLTPSPWTRAALGAIVFPILLLLLTLIG